MARKLEKLYTGAPSKFTGNILVFTSGIDEINSFIRALYDLCSDYYELLPLHGKLSPSEQNRIFKPCDKPKMIFCTRIAETAITIDKVSVVIDIGYDKEIKYDPNRRMTVMENNWISKSSAKQRAGRAGRTCAGVCYRIYSQEEFNQFDDFKTPEIKRANMDHTILKLKLFKIQNILDFDFIERPEEQVLREGIENLKMLGGLTEKEEITELGRYMAFMQTDPTISRILYEGVLRNCEIEAAKIVAIMLNSMNLFYRGGDDSSKNLADNHKFRFADETGDLLTFLNIYQEWEKIARFQEYRKKNWGRQHSINVKALKEAQELFSELFPTIREMRKLKLASQYRSKALSFSETANDSQSVKDDQTELLTETQEDCSDSSSDTETDNISNVQTDTLTVNGMEDKTVILEDRKEEESPVKIDNVKPIQLIIEGKKKPGLYFAKTYSESQDKWGF